MHSTEKQNQATTHQAETNKNQQNPNKTQGPSKNLSPSPYSLPHLSDSSQDRSRMEASSGPEGRPRKRRRTADLADSKSHILGGQKKQTPLKSVSEKNSSPYETTINLHKNPTIMPFFADSLRFSTLLAPPPSGPSGPQVPALSAWSMRGIAIPWWLILEPLVIPLYSDEVSFSLLRLLGQVSGFLRFGLLRS